MDILEKSEDKVPPFVLLPHDLLNCIVQECPKGYVYPAVGGVIAAQDWLLISVSGSSQFVRGPNKCIRLNYGEIDTAAIDAAGINLAGLVKPVLQLSEKSKHDCCFGK
ncbi:unnamed protein product [Caretta caretta]